jgi:hypothetical protein
MSTHPAFQANVLLQRTATTFVAGAKLCFGVMAGVTLVLAIFSLHLPQLAELMLSMAIGATCVEAYHLYRQLHPRIKNTRQPSAAPSSVWHLDPSIELSKSPLKTDGEQAAAILEALLTRSFPGAVSLDRLQGNGFVIRLSEAGKMHVVPLSVFRDVSVSQSSNDESKAIGVLDDLPAGVLWVELKRI